MLDNFFGMFQTRSSTMTEMMGWKWAMEHPYLFTVIKISQPYLVAILLIIGMRIIGGLFSKK